MQDLSAFAGQTLENLEVRLAGTDTVAIGPVAEFPVPASGSYTVVAHLDASGTPTLTPFENDTSEVADGNGRLTVRHTAAAPAVDVVLGDARPCRERCPTATAPASTSRPVRSPARRSLRPVATRSPTSRR